MKKQVIFLFLMMIGTLTNTNKAEQPVSLSENGDNVYLSNNYVKATISKKRALITSLRYEGCELIGKPHANWNIVTSDDDDSKVTRLPGRPAYSVRIDPSENRGERAEISLKYTYNDDTKAHPLDMDIRFALGKSDRGIYLSALVAHRKNYPPLALGQGRMIVELNPKVFDYFTVDSLRRRKMATGYDVAHGIRRNVKEANLLTTGIRKGEVEHKYDYATILAQAPTWGWTSTEKQIGCWMINPSAEYINGGPTQVGLPGHVECVLLNHWQDGHYGGGGFLFNQGEDWTKYIGPIYLYCNANGDRDALWKDARMEAARQRSLWPFTWVKEPEYPQKTERGTLSGQIHVSDSSDPHLKFSNMWVGLSDNATRANGKPINWQYEGKKYQFWVKADAVGHFCIPNIRAGNYTLNAFADGILGEFHSENIEISAGANIQLGKIDWQPQHFGKMWWEIGTPDRSAAEFRHGDHYWQWGLYLLYPKEFPNDVNFTPGKSNCRTDWNYCQPPVLDSVGRVVHSPVWNIHFERAEIPTKGKATLRLAICGTRNEVRVDVFVNNRFVKRTPLLPNMGVMHRDGIRGKEEEVNISFDTQLLKKGSNTIQLKLANVKNWTFGILYDYIRLEVQE